MKSRKSTKDNRLTISVDELAERLGISRPVAYKLVHEEGFPRVFVGRRILVPLEGLRVWLAQRAQNA